MDIQNLFVVNSRCVSHFFFQVPIFIISSMIYSCFENLPMIFIKANEQIVDV